MEHNPLHIYHQESNREGPDPLRLIRAVSRVLKARFNNLTVDDIISLSEKIINTYNEHERKEEGV